MPGKFKQKTSRLAVWALWLSRIAIPVAILSFLLMRFGGLHPSIAVICFGAAIALAVMSMLLSVAAFPGIWFEGYIGGRRLWGTFLRSLVIVIPTVTLAYFYYAIPAFSDLTTNPVDPPPFQAVLDLRAPGDNDLAPVSLSEREQQTLAYPDLSSLELDHPASIVYLLVMDVLKDQHWEVVAKTDLPQAVQSSTIEAHARSLFTGFDYVLSARIRPDGEDNSILDLRSASLWGTHDFGANANYIKAFIKGLDEKLTGGVEEYESRIEEIERQRRLEMGPMPRPKPAREVILPDEQDLMEEDSIIQ